MPPTPELAHHRARVAGTASAVHDGRLPASALDDPKRDLAAAKIEAYVKRVVAEAPPLTDEQRARLADLMRRPA
ncbi:hypothetical protein [Mycolicibacterium porcinum]|uniref:PhiRv1 phage protein n=1 Tax=Mycolicibacterium porcinum TaxID=39693 RepID=A0ABV3VK85_9MYCO